MIAIVSWLKRYRKGYHISLVSSGKTENEEKMFAFSKLNKEQISSYYKNRVTLTQDDIEYADYIWQLYCSDSPLRLETIYKFNPMSPFQHLASALEIHFKRFPSVKNGLNIVENSILKTADSSQFDSREALVNKLLTDQENYGFGDIQYLEKLRKLSTLFSSFNPVKLSKKGKMILDNQFNFYAKMRNDFSYLGGSKKYSYLYHNETNKLLKITS